MLKTGVIEFDPGSEVVEIGGVAAGAEFGDQRRFLGPEPVAPKNEKCEPRGDENEKAERNRAAPLAEGPGESRAKACQEERPLWDPRRGRKMERN